MELTFRFGLKQGRRQPADEPRVIDVEALPVEREAAAAPVRSVAGHTEAGGKRLGRYVDIYV